MAPHDHERPSGGGSSSGVSLEERRRRLAQLYHSYKAKFPHVPDVDAEALRATAVALTAAAAAAAPQKQQPAQQQRGGGASLVLVDVREADEQAVSTLPGCPSGAVQVLSRTEFDAIKARHLRSRVVCYCTAGYRSGLYAKQLIEDGYSAVNLAGGIVGWTQAGLPLAAGPPGSQGGDTRRVHVYGREWALQGDGYEAVMHSRPAAK